MLIFQNSGLSNAYRRRLDALVGSTIDFAAQRSVFLNDRYGASHMLLPVLEGERTAFFTNGDDEKLQRAWAKENGLPADCALAEILVAQIEHHRTEVFYNLDPMRYDGLFTKRLPSSVKTKIAWRAAPGKINFSGYDLVVSNFPSIRRAYEKEGVRTAEFFPAHDPALDAYAEKENRDIDVLFFGGFSRHHQKRNAILEAIASLGKKYNIVFHLDNSRYTRLAETPLGWFGPLASMRRPQAIRTVAKPPVFGRDMYERLGRAKIVINASIDLSGKDRGNMRCFETMGGGAMLLTDEGSYPPGMVDQTTLVVYKDAQDAARNITEHLGDGNWQRIAAKGHTMIKDIYSKQSQLTRFLNFV
jgi:hypothetical protein